MGGHVFGRQGLSLVPLPRLNVHVEGFLGGPCTQLVLFGLVELTDLEVVLGDLLQERLGYIRRLRAHQLNGFVPLPSVDRRVNCLLEDASLDEVRNGRFSLLLSDQPVSPLLLKPDDLGGEGFAGQIHGLALGVALDVRVHSPWWHLHLFEELACFLVHASVLQAACDLLQQFGLLARLVLVDHVRCSCRQPSLEVQVDGSHLVAFSVLGLCCLLLLAGL